MAELFRDHLVKMKLSQLVDILEKINLLNLRLQGLDVLGVKVIICKLYYSILNMNDNVKAFLLKTGIMEHKHKAKTKTT